jgi:hypothetical protein
MLMKLVDLSSQISLEVDRAQAVIDAGGVASGTFGDMHIAWATENGKAKVAVVPVQQGPSEPPSPGFPQGKYGTPQWGPCPEDLRAVGYHDPTRPGTVATDGGQDFVWVQDQGYVPATTVTGDVALGKLSMAAHASIDAIINSVHAGK